MCRPCRFAWSPTGTLWSSFHNSFYHFLDCSFWVSFECIFCWFFCAIKRLLTIRTTQIFFCEGQKSIAFDINSISGFSWISNYLLTSLITRVKFLKFLLSSISRDTKFWLVNHTSIYGNWMKYFWVDMIHCVKVSAFGVILVCIFPYSGWIRRDTPYCSGLLMEYLVADQLTYLEQMYTKLLNHADIASCWYQQYYNELIPLH